MNINSEVVSSSFNQINMILTELCKNENHYIINMLSNNFLQDTKPNQTVARDLYIVFFGETTKEDEKTIVMK